jgi:hypothetical protein
LEEAFKDLGGGVYISWKRLLKALKDAFKGLGRSF